MVTIEEIEKKIDVVYDVKDDYSISKDKRLETIKQSVDSIGGELDNILLQITNNANLSGSQNIEQQDYLRGYDKPYNVRAYLHYLHGKLLNAQSNYDKQAENLLSKAIRLEPNLLEAWNALGECYWKKDDLKSAMDCFLAVINNSNALLTKDNNTNNNNNTNINKLEEKENKKDKIAKKIALRRLSMVLRQISPLEGNTNEIETSRKKNIIESVARAREAVEIDPLDTFSWYILGNGYLALFFSVSSLNSDITFGDLRKALAAYQQAEKCPNSNKNNIPDIHFNRAVLFKYEEEYKKATEGFEKALALDSSWESPKLEISQISHFSENLYQVLTKKNNPKSKKIKNLIEKIPSSINLVTSLSKAYGISPSHKVKPFSNLEIGENSDAIIVGKVVAVVPKQFLPVSALIVDKEGNLIVISVYNVMQDGIRVSNLLILSNPFVKKIVISVNGKDVEYKCIQTIYSKLLINEKPAQQAHYVQMSLSMEKDNN